MEEGGREAGQGLQRTVPALATAHPVLALCYSRALILVGTPQVSVLIHARFKHTKAVKIFFKTFWKDLTFVKVN